jgi:glutamate carboxypeptidase
MTFRATALAFALGAILVPAFAPGQTADGLRARVAQERTGFLETLKDLVSIESGSGDVDGVLKIGELIGSRLRALGGDVELVDVPAEIVRFENTPPRLGKMVIARFRGTGSRRILLLAHMDTVYPRGVLAQRPFRIDGDRAYGPGIADDKQGVALILHTLAILGSLNVREYGLITVLITPDEEVSSPGSRSTITRLGSEHDIVLSCEPAGQQDALTLATMGTGAVQLKVTGRASHAGVAPEQGRNALYELAHQMMQTRDLSDPATGVKMNWTIASSGTVRNVIPADARGTADIRVERVADYDTLEQKVRERTAKRLIPDTTVTVVFERMRPPLEAHERSLRVAAQARELYREAGGTLLILDRPDGGGTDAAFAALQTMAPVLEGMGLTAFGYHSNDAEYVDIASIEPRLYLLTRTIIEVSRGRIVLGPN